MNNGELNKNIDNDLDNRVKEAKESDGYAIALTYRKKRGEIIDNHNTNVVNDDFINYHYFIRRDFPTPDIIPGIENCIDTLRIIKPIVPETTKPPIKDWTKEKKLKIAILSHLNHAPDSYSIAKGIKSQVEMLMQYGHEVSLFVIEGSKLDYGCKMMPVVPGGSRKKWVVDEVMKNKFIDVLRRELTDNYDICLIHDFLIGDSVSYMAAVRECGVKIPFIVWARSGVKENLKMDTPNFRWVYMNYADSKIFADHIGVPLEKVRTVFNTKDPAKVFNWDDTTKMIVDKTKLYDSDIVQVYPICTSRLTSKGVPSVIKVFGKLKELGNKVRLIICNSNGKRRGAEIEDMLNLAENYGLTREEVIFTSLLATNEYPIYSEVPHKTVMNLMRLANLTVFPTTGEVSSHLLLEASLGKTLLVVNDDLNSMYDFVDKSNVLYHPFSSNFSVNFHKRDDDSLLELAKSINGQLKANKSDLTFRHVWRRHRTEWVYENQLAPVLYEAINDFKEGKL